MYLAQAGTNYLLKTKYYLTEATCNNLHNIEVLILILKPDVPLEADSQITIAPLMLPGVTQMQTDESTVPITQEKEKDSKATATIDAKHSVSVTEVISSDQGISFDKFKKEGVQAKPQIEESIAIDVKETIPESTNEKLEQSDVPESKKAKSSTVLRPMNTPSISERTPIEQESNDIQMKPSETCSVVPTLNDMN